MKHLLWWCQWLLDLLLSDLWLRDLWVADLWLADLLLSDLWLAYLLQNLRECLDAWNSCS